MKRSEGYIYKNKQGKHVARITFTDPAAEETHALPDGKLVKRVIKKRRNVTKTFQSKTEAKDYLEKMRPQVRRADTRTSLSDRTKVSALIDLCLEEHYCEIKTVKERRIQGVRNTISPRTYAKQAKDFFGERLVREVDIGTLQAYRNYLINLPVRSGDGTRSISMINHGVAFMRVCFNFAVRRGILERSPFQGAKGLIITDPDSARKRVYGFGEELALLSHVSRQGHRLRLLIPLTADTGMRRGEITSLLVKDLDFQRNAINLRAINTKTNRSRTIQMTARVREVLLEASDKKKPDQRVFDISTYNKAWTSLCERAGVKDAHYHDWRHTFFTRCVLAGVPHDIIVQASGHSSDEWQRYLNAERVNDMLTPMSGQTAEEVRAHAKTVLRGLRSALGFEEIDQLLKD